MTTLYFPDIPGARVVAVEGYAKGNTFFITERSVTDCRALIYPTIAAGMLFDEKEKARILLTEHFRALLRDVNWEIGALQKKRIELEKILEALR